MKTTHHRHIPIRMCMICRRRFPKNSLNRFVKGTNSQGKMTVYADEKKHMPGRGFYVCNSRTCQKKLKK